MKIIGTILYIPFVWLIFELLYKLLNMTMVLYIQLSPLWIILLYIFLGTTISALFFVGSEELHKAFTRYTISQKFNFWVFIGIAVFFALLKVYRTWTYDTDYQGSVLLGAIAITFWVITISFGLIAGLYKARENY